MTNTHKYTLAGCLAILIWSTTVGLVRNVAEQLGPIGGAAMIYSVSYLFLLIFLGAPRFKLFSFKYLLIGGTLFVSYEICSSLALGMANNRIQAVEMGVINYLWPSLVVLLAVLWITYLMRDEPAIVFTSGAAIDLLITGVAMGSGYALWNIGIIGGNMMLLATLSYFTPLLSTFSSALILNIELIATFWQGVVMVTIASLLCWWFTREKPS